MVGVGVAWGREVLDWGPATVASGAVTGASTGAGALGAMVMLVVVFPWERVVMTGVRSLKPVRYLCTTKVVNPD